MRVESEHESQGSPDSETNFHQINERIYQLLLKNVSRDAPLTPDEIQVRISNKISIGSVIVIVRFFLSI